MLPAFVRGWSLYALKHAEHKSWLTVLSAPLFSITTAGPEGWLRTIYMAGLLEPDGFHKILTDTEDVSVQRYWCLVSAASFASEQF